MMRWLPLLVCLLLAQPAAASPELLSAARRGDANRLMVLMMNGADPNSRDDRRQTPLHLAIAGEADKAVEYLLAHPALDVGAINQSGETPLMLAALRGRLDWVQALVRRGALINEPGWNALHYACSGPDQGVVAWLLAQGADIEAISANGTTALMMAAGYGEGSSVELLLKAGAQPQRRNEQGLSAADFARRAGRDRIADRLEALRGLPGNAASR